MLRLDLVTTTRLTLHGIAAIFLASQLVTLLPAAILVYVVISAIAAGASLSPGVRLKKVDPEAPVAFVPILVWAALASIMIGVGGAVYGGGTLSWFDMAILGGSFRSFLDVVLIVVLYSAIVAFWKVSREEGGVLQTVGLGTFVILAAVFSWLGAEGSRAYILLWGQNALSEEVRFLLLFDMCNGLWLGGIVPLWVARELVRKESHLLLEYGLFSRRGWGWVAMWAVVPMLVGLGASRWIGNPGLVDQLPMVWWVRKLASVFLWTGVYEEMTFRVVIVAVLLFAFRGLETKKAVRLATILSAGMFAFAHVNIGWLAVLISLLLGVTFTSIILRIRNVDLCILGHTVFDTVLVRWNLS